MVISLVARWFGNRRGVAYEDDPCQWPLAETGGPLWELAAFVSLMYAVEFIAK